MAIPACWTTSRMSCYGGLFPMALCEITNGNLSNILAELNYLDLSYHHYSSDEVLYNTTRLFASNNIVVFSAAHNNLTSVPRRTLESVADSLKYLTLCGNKFNGLSLETQRDGVAWASFPILPKLAELDISNCKIEHITREVFRNVTNLKNLYMSHNRMLVLLSDTFYYVPSLHYLDLSFTNTFDYSTKPSLDSIINLFYGLKIQQSTFKYLPNLVYLDMSHSKLTRNSAVAFNHLGDKLRYLSLCFTAFPVIGHGMFKNLEGMDLSGNAYAAYNLLDGVFDGMSKTLTVLYFEMSNLKNISWIRNMSKLRILGLAGNNINSISSNLFSTLTNLQIVDLSSNHVGNWYNRVFANNKNLRVLSLRDNNINIITSEMLKDFTLLDYLSMGENNFVCDCLLRDLVDVSESNNQNCARQVVADALQYLSGKVPSFPLDTQSLLNMTSILGSHAFKRLQKKNEERSPNGYRLSKKFRFVVRRQASLKTAVPCTPFNSSPSQKYNRLNETMLLKFQLLDYEDEQYWCFNETEKLSFVDLNCHKRSLVDDITNQLNSLTFYVLVSVGTLLGVSLVVAIIYVKRWHIYYYYSSLKSAALMSEAAKDRMNSAYEGDDMMYDIFISYCQNDRDWVLHELMPNVEENGDISICLHERDFQIGVTILDNIISCMDRSRSLMLIISSNFLLSHWCQFEMHLAQHRMFDICKDQLILVFLEDIPRSKRPKNLQYLMDVKTYIKWPGCKNNGRHRPEEYKVFWRRLKRSMQRMANNA
ncbi:toll-like receptor 13 isoform X2 [Stomoxys calcitrans]|uniref:TIR domain-containing protein n=1 Tax=Stomoxys calcitrans TaxID=35570 RepID=A0A1I8P2A3_STOCA|nr:toll-like receptor 13 isoform X2 [Stomoxys calcitrans]